MRNIKFRGKKKSDGKWLFGDLIHDNIGGCYIYPINCENLYKKNAVNSETIGQFTELYDKNGNEIYEGDIVDVWSAGSNMPNGIIKWSKYTGSFFIGDKQRSRCWQLSGDNEDKETLIIVGNIYDNPELLNYKKEG